MKRDTLAPTLVGLLAAPPTGHVRARSEVPASQGSIVGLGIVCIASAHRDRAVCLSEHTCAVRDLSLREERRCGRHGARSAAAFQQIASVGPPVHNVLLFYCVLAAALGPQVLAFGGAVSEAPHLRWSLALRDRVMVGFGVCEHFVFYTWSGAAAGATGQRRREEVVLLTRSC